MLFTDRLRIMKQLRFISLTGKVICDKYLQFIARGFCILDTEASFCIIENRSNVVKVSACGWANFFRKLASLRQILQRVRAIVEEKRLRFMRKRDNCSQAMRPK